MARLNPTQRRLVREINDLLDRFNLNPLKITQEGNPDSRTPRLQLARNQLMRGQIIMDYTLIDEFLNTRIAHYFFGKKRPFWDLWRTKRFTLFNYHVLEELSLMKKLQLVRAISPLPNRIRDDIERLNALRNGIAHAFFPENRKKSKPAWKGKGIFTQAGIERYQEGMRVIVDYFLPGTPHAFSGELHDDESGAGGMTTPSHWEIICTHEAGHAVAALALFDDPADIYVRPTNDPAEPYSASYRRVLDGASLTIGKPAAIREVMVLAEGAKAEAVCLGITASRGFGKDKSQINIVRNVCESACSDELNRSLPVPEATLVQARGIRQEVTTEIKSDFLRTTQLIEEHRDVLEAIASAALRSIENIGEENLGAEQILLAKADLRRIWDSR